MCRETAHYSQSYTGIYNQKTAASASRRHTLTFLEVANSWLIYYHASKGFAGRNLSSQYPICLDTENLNLTVVIYTYTNPSENTLLCPTSTELLREPPLFVKMFTSFISVHCRHKTLVPYQPGGGDSWRKKRIAMGTTILKKYNRNMSYKDSRIITTSPIYPIALHTFKYKAS